MEGTFFVYNANFAPLELVDNPNKSGINQSNKVVKVQVHAGGPNSGIWKINFTGSGQEPILDYPSCPSCTDGRYDRLRFKYYKGSLLNRYVELEPNGSATSPKTIVQAQGIDEWEYIEFDLEYASYTTFQVRVNRNDVGNGSAVGTAEGDAIYIDDIEFYNSTDGPSSSLSRNAIDAIPFSCTSEGGNLFTARYQADTEARVQVDLISLDGRSETLYNQVAAGEVEIPFQVNGKGVYCVRLTVDNIVSKTVKIVSK